MKCEITIREILSGNTNAEAMADSICKFMGWDRDKLIEAIQKHGCSSAESRGKIITEFWGNLKK